MFTEPREHCSDSTLAANKMTAINIFVSIFAGIAWYSFINTKLIIFLVFPPQYLKWGSPNDLFNFEVKQYLLKRYQSEFCFIYWICFESIFKLNGLNTAFTTLVFKQKKRGKDCLTQRNFKINKGKTKGIINSILRQLLSGGLLIFNEINQLKRRL